MPLQWTDALAIGVPEIDAQHQEMFRRVDRLLEATRRNDPAEVGALLGFLREYVVTHFGAEEKLMQEARYPGYRVHRAEHERFVEGLRSLEAEYAAEGPSARLLFRMNRQIGDWLRDHVYLTDSALGRFVRGI